MLATLLIENEDIISTKTQCHRVNGSNSRHPRQVTSTTKVELSVLLELTSSKSTTLECNDDVGGSMSNRDPADIAFLTLIMNRFGSRKNPLP